MIKRIGSYFYRNFFDRDLAFEYRLRSIFFFEALILSLLSFSVNTLLGATNEGVIFQGFVNLLMIATIFLPLPMKKKFMPPMLLVLIYAYVPFLYFLYAGYDGSVLYFAAIGILLLSFLYKGRVRVGLVALNIALYVVAILLQANVPGLVVPMAFPENRVNDLLAAVVFTLFGMFALAAYVNKAYEDERVRNIYLVDKLADINEELKERSVRDALTGLFNRRYLTEVVEQMLDRSRREGQTVCFIMYDLDHFKRVNDTFGHALGDDILVKTSQAALRQLRKSDVLARYGGEEFMIALYPEELDNAIDIAERIRQAVEEILLPDGSAITVSLGVIEALPTTTVDEAFHQVDEYLYKAKSNGRNRVEYPGRVG